MCNWSPGRTKKCAIVLLTASHYESATLNLIQFSPVQSLGCVWLFVTAACQIPLSITNSQSLLKLMSIESVMPSNHLIFCHLLLLLPLIFPSIRIFSNKSTLHVKWQNYWNFTCSISPSVNIQGRFPLELTSLIALQSKGLLRIFSHTSVWKHQFFSAQPSLWINSYMAHTWLLEKP